MQLMIAPYVVVAVRQEPLDRHRAGHRLPALQGRGPAGVRQSDVLDQPGQRHQQRLQRSRGVSACASATWGSSPTQFAVGATYASKISMGNFDKYKGLFAQQGGFDIPSNFTVGVAIRPTSQWLIALDFERIFYDDAPSVNNPSQHRLLRPAVVRRAGQPNYCLGGEQRRGLRLAEHRRLEARRPVHDRTTSGRSAPATTTPTTRSRRRTSRSTSSLRASSRTSGRSATTYRIDKVVRDHRRVHVRAEQLGDGPEPLRCRSARRRRRPRRSR